MDITRPNREEAETYDISLLSKKQVKMPVELIVSGLLRVRILEFGILWGVMLAELHGCMRNPANYDVSLSFSRLEKGSR